MMKKFACTALLIVCFCVCVALVISTTNASATSTSKRKDNRQSLTATSTTGKLLGGGTKLGRSHRQITPDLLPLQQKKSKTTKRSHEKRFKKRQQKDKDTATTISRTLNDDNDKDDSSGADDESESFELIPQTGTQFKTITQLSLRSSPLCASTLEVIEMLPAGQMVVFTGGVEFSPGCLQLYYSVHVANEPRRKGWLVSAYLNPTMVSQDRGSEAGLAAARFAEAMVNKKWSNEVGRTMGPDTFDAAGLVYKAYESVGKKIVSTLEGYAQFSPTGLTRAPSQRVQDLEIGDLLWKRASDDTSSTVGIYVGGDRVISVVERGVVKEHTIQFYKAYVGWDVVFRAV